MSSNLSTGFLGEQIAKSYLSQKGYSIVETNFRAKVGEIDIIATYNNKFVFIEVKCRVGDTHGKPYEAVTKHKILKLYKTIHLYLLQKNIKNRKLAIEVVSIILNNDKTLNTINHFDCGLELETIYA